MDTDEIRTAHVVQANDLGATLRVDERAGSTANARRIGKQLAADYWRDHEGAAVTVQFDDCVYVEFALGRVKVWR